MSTTRLDGRHPFAPPAPLEPFVELGILTSADVHVATTLTRLFDEPSPDVLLAVAFAARAPRAGHSCLDVDLVAAGVTEELPGRDAAADVDEAVAALPWPEPDAWLAATRDSPLVAAGHDPAPIVVEGRQVFLRRYRDHEVAVADDLRRRAAALGGPVDEAALEALLDRLFPDAEPADPQRRAASTAARRRLTVVAGGPGTGKTWTVARILAVLLDQARRAGHELHVGLCAPTGKAAARLDEGIREALGSMDVEDDLRAAIAGVDAGMTIHRLLGVRRSGGFWHHRDRPLPHDVIVVDETSMASLSLTAHLLAAIRPDARVVLVGDPDQLASVEAGSVLADVVGHGAGAGAEPARRSEAGTVGDVEAGLVVLTRPRRFGADSGIGELARAIRAGDGDRAVALLRTRDDLVWHETSEPTGDDLAEVRGLVVSRTRGLLASATTGDVASAIAQLDELAILCAHRRGRDGVRGWDARVDRWLVESVDGWRPHDPWQPGRIVLATGNDRLLGVFNGDLGVVIATDDGVRVAFHAPDGAPDRRSPAPVPPVRLEHAEPMHAMTIHKSQGSQWDHVVVALPEAGSRILTRQLLYTAVTRAAERLTLFGDEAVVRHAVNRPVQRASRLRQRLAAGPTD